MINKNCQYISVDAAKDRIFSTLSILDKDVADWRQLEKSLGFDFNNIQSSSTPLQMELVKEFNDFFTMSIQIRSQLTNLLHFVGSLSEN